jgi:hypothetical protein
MRLYDSAWVRIEGSDAPLQVFKNKNNAALFDVGDHQYDIDGRAAPTNPAAPVLVSLLSLSEIRELALSLGVTRDVRKDAGRRMK